MTTRVPNSTHSLSQETVEHLQELILGLRDSINYHREAAEKIDDQHVKETFKDIADERREIAEGIGTLAFGDDTEPAKDGTWMGSLRTIWTSFRAGLNAGDTTVVLIEAERAEDAIVAKFKDILPKLAGSPINDKLLGYFKEVKKGHDRVLALRNAHQNA